MMVQEFEKALEEMDRSEIELAADSNEFLAKHPHKEGTITANEDVLIALSKPRRSFVRTEVTISHIEVQGNKSKSDGVLMFTVGRDIDKLSFQVAFPFEIACCPMYYSFRPNSPRYNGIESIDLSDIRAWYENTVIELSNGTVR